MRNYHLKIALISSLLCLPLLVFAQSTEDAAAPDQSKEDVSELNDEIQQKTDEIKTLEQRLHSYEQQILDKQGDALSLKNQVDILDSKIASTEVKIDQAEAQLDVTQKQIEVLHGQIERTEKDIDGNQESLKNLIRETHKAEQQSPLELFFSSSTLSEFYTQIEYSTRLQNDVQTQVNHLQEIKNNLETKRTELKDKKADVARERTNLQVQEEELGGEVAYKEELLTSTENDEAKFKALYEEARQDQLRIEAEVNQLTREAQERIRRLRDEVEKKLNDEEQQENLTDEEQQVLEDFDGTVDLAWPIASRKVTCPFHCGGYPFAGAIGSHNAIDISTPQGTPIYAAEAGYVIRVIFDPNSTSYAMISILHGDNVTSTAYGHISGSNVQPNQYVKKGELIGWTGATPGTPGAGPFTTGAHLHFEVRKNGLPVDPLLYLP